jgi:hypothetical protein
VSDEDASDAPLAQDFSKALSDEVRSIKSKKNTKISAIKNDVKGVVFIRALDDVDVDEVVESILGLVTSKAWKPRYSGVGSNSF